MDERCKQYHSALSRCAELLDNMKDGDPITEVPDFLAAYLASQSQAAQPSDEQLRETDGYKLGWMEGMQEGAELATGGEKTAADVEAEFADLLPGSYYMDPPDGGSPSVLEQVSRMAEDAAQWRAHLAGQSQATRAVPDLHNAIMNLPCERTMSHFATTDTMRAYKEGHRDARHAAAELVNEAVAAQEVTQQAAIPQTAEEAIAFIGSHCDCVEERGSPEETRFQLSAHDLLSAFRWWFDTDLAPTSQQAAKAETAEQAEGDQASVLPPTRGTESQHEAIIGAIGRGYCTHTNSHKAVDFELVHAMADEVEKELARRCCAQREDKSAKGSDLAPTTSTVSAPLGYISDDAMATLSTGSGVLTAIVPRAINGADLAIYAGTVSASGSADTGSAA